MVPTKQGNKNNVSYSITDTESHSARKGRNKKKKKKNSQQKRAKRNNVNNICVSNAMTTWAENFTVAATWQLKHQVAYWKARAVSLQYENNMLHEVIRRNHLAVPTTSKLGKVQIDSELENTAVEHSDCPTEDSEQSDSETEENDAPYTGSESENVENIDEDFEVSEEFIQFLTANAKYKEDARRERERIKAKLEEESTQIVPEPQESAEDKISRYKELHGDNYKRIIALEMYLMSDFQNVMDKHKAGYWPNIPFNFNS